MIGVCIIFWWIEMSIIILVIEMPCIILPLKQLWLHFVLGCFVGVGHGEKVFYDRQALNWVFAPQQLVTKLGCSGGSLRLGGVCVGFKDGPVM